MERLTQRDLRSLLDCVRDIYGIRSLSAFRTHMVSALRRVVPADIASYNEVDPGRQSLTTLIDPPDALDFADSLEIFRRHMSEHPLIAHYARTKDGRALKISDFLGQTRFHRLGIYDEFFRRAKVEHQMAFTLPGPSSCVIGVALSRSRPDFTERDRLCLELLRPHLIQAYRNAQAMTRWEQTLALLEQAVDAGGVGVVVLTREAQIRLATPRARQWLAQYFGGPSRQVKRLPEAVRRWVGHQQALPARHGDLPRPPKPLRVELSGTCLVIRLLSDSDRRILLLEERLTAPQPTRLESFGLTRREAEVLAWVAEGKTNEEIGRILATSSRTVAKHLEHIYPKLGVETRTAAARLALTQHPEDS